MTIALKENCYQDDVKWSAAFTFNAALMNIVDIGIVFKARIVRIQASLKALYTCNKRS